MLSVTFFVEGVPVPQGSVRSFRNRVVAVTPRLRAWRNAVNAEAAAYAPLVPLDGPCGIAVKFVLPRPKKPKFWVPAVKPDGDKLLRAVQDALTQTKDQIGFVKDDSRFVDGRYSKRYGTIPGAQITVWEVTE